MKRDDVFYQAMLAVEFFLEMNAAEKAGYRPCLRSRPESAPLSPAWFGKSSVVQRALRAISPEIFFEANKGNTL